MAELATLARPYAEAAYKALGGAAANAASLSSMADTLDAFATLASHADVKSVAGNPKVTAAQVNELFAAGVKSPLSNEAKNLLAALVQNARLSALPEIATQFRALKNTASGIQEATIYSAFPLEGAALADLQTLLEKKFGSKLLSQVKIDSSLIGGVRVVVGDEVLDTSVKARLEKMKVSLMA
jgi:F-type H+-transporting ATPase subunit delta